MSERRLTVDGPYAVLVIDMTRFDEGDDILVSGFPNIDVAREYARRRTRDSLEDLRGESRSIEDLRLKWAMFGEDCVVVEHGFRASSEMDFFVTHPATLSQRDWSSIEQEVADRATVDEPRQV